MNTILITGSTGFVGCKLIQDLLEKNYKLHLVCRSKQSNFDQMIGDNCRLFMLDLSKPSLDLTGAMNNVDTVIHLAARVHMMNDTSPDSLAAFREVNVEYTKRLAELAISSKAKRFIYISSLHVNGNRSVFHPFNEMDKPEPPSPYAVSKWEAEQYLNQVAKTTNIEVVIIRPPLVYGPRVKANFLSLLKLTKTGLPMPVGLLNCKRSMISVNNLVNFIICCISHPKAANETFLVSDDSDVSTKDLIYKLIKLFDKTPILLPIPVKLLYILGSLVGKKDIVDRLCSPLQVDISKAKTLLNWQPIQTLDDGLKEVVEWYKKEYL